MKVMEGWNYEMMKGYSFNETVLFYKWYEGSPAFFVHVKW